MQGINYGFARCSSLKLLVRIVIDFAKPTVVNPLVKLSNSFDCLLTIFVHVPEMHVYQRQRRAYVSTLRVSKSRPRRRRKTRRYRVTTQDSGLLARSESGEPQPALFVKVFAEMRRKLGRNVAVVSGGESNDQFIGCSGLHDHDTNEERAGLPAFGDSIGFVSPSCHPVAAPSARATCRKAGKNGNDAGR